jgi:CRISPR-associated endonuclease/helicase Cas3
MEQEPSMPPEQSPPQYLARTSEDGCATQPLREHLRNVAALARTFAEEACPGNGLFAETAYLAGLLHDMGKYRVEFQERLLGKRQRDKESAHAVYGAAAACIRFNSLAIAFSIAGHHAGLHNEERLASLVGGTEFNAQERFPELLERAERWDELGPLPRVDPLGCDETDERDKRRYDFLTRMLFSLVVDADRLDSEQFEQEYRLGRAWERQRLPLHAELLLERLQEARLQKAANHPDDHLNRLRNAIFDACLKRGADLPPGFFTLTVPTGGAKTLSSMAFSLAHSSQQHLRRIIVVIPYLSIIEQNAREYRAIFGADHVLEHHSAVEISDNPASPQASDAELATENWDVPIIVTTSVQFIETLFAASPSRARRLHNVARSVVVFDEVQTLPAHLLEPTLDILRELRTHYGVSFVFCSATQPGFRKSPSLKRGFEDGELEEIASNPAEAYRTLRRVNYRVEPAESKWDWVRLATEILRQPQGLCVVNLRRHAFAAWDAIRQRLTDEGRQDDSRDAVFHLSSAMCAAHRLDLLGLSPSPPAKNVKARLKLGKPCWVISTQLIEAGVDVDFPIVFRAIGPLDSIVQAGGRCNREGQLTDKTGHATLGQVIVFHLEDSGLPRGIYEKGTCIAPGYLADPEKLATDAAIFRDYFTELYQLTPTDHARKGEHTIQQDRAAFNFRTVAERARVKEDTVSVIVPYRRGTKLVDKIQRTRRFDRKTLRRLQRYMVNLRRGPNSDHDQLLKLGALEPLLPSCLEIPVLAKWCYDPHRGVVVRDRSPEDLIV